MTQPVASAAGQLLFDRKVKLTIAPPLPASVTGSARFKTPRTQTAQVITELRVKFKVIKSLRKEPNHSEIEVYNLNDTSRKLLQGKGCRAWLEAGYGTSLTQIFSGDVRYVDHHTDKADWITKLELGDGERAAAHARVSGSYRKGTSKADILKDYAAQSGLDLGNVGDFYQSLSGKVLGAGWAAEGLAAKEIDRLLKSVGLTWSIQDGGIQILAAQGYTPALAPLIDEDHGMIGSPEMGSAPTKSKPRVLKVKVLGFGTPAYRPGSRINLQSRAHKGVFRIVKVEYEGDTHSEDWHSVLEVQV